MRAPTGMYVLLVFAGLVAPSSSWADHRPDELLIPGKAEHRIAGFDVVSDQLRSVIHRFGTPKRQKEGTAQGYPTGSGWAEHEWSVSGAKFVVTTEFYTDESGGRVESISSVIVQGIKKVPSLRTGRGAGLGDSLADLERKYGPKHLAGSLRGSGPDSSTVTFCFEDETALEFVLDATGNVIQVFLAPSAE